MSETRIEGKPPDNDRPSSGSVNRIKRKETGNECSGMKQVLVTKINCYFSRIRMHI